MWLKKRQKNGLIKSDSKLDLFLKRKYNSDLFTYQEIFGMLMPIVLDQFFISIISLLTTAMISSSSQESVSAVSLVSPLYMMIYAIYNAISAGGTVIVAQYKGRNDKEKIRLAAGQVMFATSVLAIIFCIVMVICSKSLVQWMFRAADPIVIQKASEYLVGVAISLIFHSIYLGVFAAFRGVGESKICLHLSIIINVIYLLASILFINILHLDILGSTLSLNLARLIGAFVAVWLIMRPKAVLRVYPRDIFHIDFSIIKSIFKVGIPFALEQVFFNGGSMIVQTYIVQLGTISLAANAVTNSAFNIFFAAGLGVATLSITVVGQCVGANDKEQAKQYGKKMIGLGTIAVLLSLVVFIPLMPLILKMYQAPSNTLNVIYRLVIIGAASMPLFWPVSNIMPAVLRAAGDSVFSSVVSLITMWVIRVALGYLFAIPLGFGVEGVWVSLAIEWAVRTVIFQMRFRSGKWLEKKLI